MDGKIIDKESAEHYPWGDGCDGWIFVDTVGLSVKRERMPAGTSEKRHFHLTARQFFYILSGTATFYLEDEKIEAGAQTGLSIAPLTGHSIANETESELDFLVVSQPSTNDDRILV